MAAIERHPGFWVATHGTRRSGPFANMSAAMEGLKALLGKDEVLLSGHRFDRGTFWGFTFETRKRAKAHA